VPVSYRIDTTRGVVLSTATGVVTDLELIAHKERLRADPAFQPWFRQLFDFSGATENQVTGRGVRELAASPALGKGSKRALVVRDVSGFGLARMFQTLRDEQPDESIAIFPDVATARVWLGLE
jgi:hypothetical protein